MMVLRKAGAGFDYLLNILALLAAILIIVVWAIVCSEIILRYFLGRPLIWAVEVSEYILLYITFLGTAWVLRREGHVSVDAVTDFLKPRSQAMVNTITSSLGVILCLALFWFSMVTTWDFFQRGVYSADTVLKVPLFLVYGIIVPGSFLLFVQFLRRTFKYLRSWRMTASEEQRS